MNRSLARRYAPLAALVVVQLLIIAIAPSRAPEATDLTFGGDGGFFDDELAAGDPNGFDDELEAEGFVLDEATGEFVNPETGERRAAPGRQQGTGGSGGQAGGGPRGDGGGAAAGGGDTSHCRDGRQHDVTPFAPPCVGKFPEGANNGGATYQGVTADKIRITRYAPAPNAAVDAILASQDLAANAEEVDEFERAALEFLNSRYEFYGREIEVVKFTGSCPLLPPEPQCLRDEARRLIAETRPFAVLWNTPLGSAFFDEVAAHRVIALGGHHFPDSFRQNRRPFVWDTRISGSVIARHLAEYWCKRLAGGNAVQAGDPRLTLQERRLGIITPDDPANVQVLNELKQMVRNCGSGVVAEYQYAQDIDRANEQRNAGIDRMQENNVTTISCICDGIAPHFMVITSEERQYRPEYILAGSGLMDHDAFGRIYGSAGTQWQQAWGLSMLGAPQPFSDNDAARVWRATGRSGQPYNTALFAWHYYEMLGGIIQMAGPNLNPGTFEQGARRLGTLGGGQHETRRFGEGDYTWISDMREVYWSHTTPSRLDGRPGSYVALNEGRRYDLGQWPQGEPQLPNKPR